MAKSQVHYNIEPLLKKVPNANIYLIVGEKSNGKSYQIKKYILDRYNKKNERFALIRRWEADMTNRVGRAVF